MGGEKTKYLEIGSVRLFDVTLSGQDRSLNAAQLALDLWAWCIDTLRYNLSGMEIACIIGIPNIYFQRLVAPLTSLSKLNKYHRYKLTCCLNCSFKVARRYTQAAGVHLMSPSTDFLQFEQTELVLLDIISRRILTVRNCYYFEQGRCELCDSLAKGLSDAGITMIFEARSSSGEAEAILKYRNAGVAAERFVRRKRCIAIPCGPSSRHLRNCWRDWILWLIKETFLALKPSLVRHRFELQVFPTNVSHCLPEQFCVSHARILFYRLLKSLTE